MPSQSWIHLEEFIKEVSKPKENAEKCGLKSHIKPWAYELPIYTTNETEIMETIILFRLCKAGLVQGEIHQGKFCFRLSARGRGLIVI